MMPLRALATLPCLFLLSVASPSALDVNEAGRVLATLNDWRALLFAMLCIIFLLLGALLWAFSKVAKAIEAVAAMREATSTIKDGLTDIRNFMGRIEAETARRNQ